MEIALVVLGIIAVGAGVLAAWLGRERSRAVSELGGLEAEVAAAGRERDAVRAEVARLQGEIRVAGDALSRIQVEAAELRERLAAEIEARERELGHAARLHDEQVANLRQEHAQELEATREAHGLRERTQAEVYREREGALGAANERLLKQIEQMQAALRESFAATAQEALKQSSEQFLRLAEQRMNAAAERGTAELDKRRVAVEEMLRPIAETLKRTDEKLGAIEKERVGTQAGLAEQIRGMQESNRMLREETGKLVNALKKPEVRGRYGEVQLRRVAELAGMSAYCDFSEQPGQRGDDGRLVRPDMVIKLPNERTIAVDAKTNTLAYLEACEARSDGERDGCLERFARHVAEQVVSLGKKGYWSGLDDSPDFVVMFVPGDQFLDAALARRADLLEQASERGVILASPSTLIGLLRAVAVGWREKKIDDQARELFDLGRQLHERSAVVVEHISRLGDALEGAVNRYNQVVGSFQTRFTPTLRRFEEAGAKSGKELVDAAEITVRPRLGGGIGANGETGLN